MTPPERRSKPDVSSLRGDDLSDWILSFQSDDAAEARHALERWRATRSVPWMVAALRHDWRDDELLAAAASVPTESPAYEIVSYYRLSRELDAGAKEAARGEIDRMLGRPLSKSTANLFRALRMRAAPDLAGFLSFAARPPVMLTSTWNQGETPDRGDADPVPSARGQLLFDRDSIKILNERTPLRVLREAALSGNVPRYSERDFVLSAFTRALLLDDFENGRPLSERLTALGADRERYLEVYRAAADSLERRFAGIFYVLHHPESRPYFASGMGRWGNPGRIDNYRDNWWCPVDLAVDLDARTNLSDWRQDLPPRASADAPAWSAAFLSDADRAQAKAEMAKLAATQSGPDYLLRETMRYARAHPTDQRVPEALHYALRSQRYGCVREQTAEAAEQVWRYMWRLYPKSGWTRKSNYHFEPANLPESH
ncbi:MAG: hypothetical protein JST11_07730 [Acidobacteria bacterium]|nr:hypothetical protein [Acidobacteriota bacterium]